MTWKTRLAGLMMAAVATVAAAEAQAHALLDKAEPAVGTTVPQPPAQVLLHFTERVEPLFSEVQVTDAAGRPVSSGPATPVPGHEDELAVPVGPLTPGTYSVAWKVVSVDTHVTSGHFTFTVGGGGVRRGGHLRTS